MRKFLIAFILGIFAALPVQAADETRVAFNAVVPKQSFVPDALLLHKVAGPECRACRRICVEDYKEDCDDDEDDCSRMFVRCMRYCWNNECR